MHVQLKENALTVLQRVVPICTASKTPTLQLNTFHTLRDIAAQTSETAFHMTHVRCFVQEFSVASVAMVTKMHQNGHLQQWTLVLAVLVTFGDCYCHHCDCYCHHCGMLGYFFEHF